MEKIDSEFIAQIKNINSYERLELLHKLICEKIPAKYRRPYLDALNKVEDELFKKMYSSLSYL